MLVLFALPTLPTHVYPALLAPMHAFSILAANSTDCLTLVVCVILVAEGVTALKARGIALHAEGQPFIETLHHTGSLPVAFLALSSDRLAAQRIQLVARTADRIHWSLEVEGAYLQELVTEPA